MTPTETAIHAYFAAIRRLDSEAWVACFAPDAEVRDPADTARRIGEQAHRTFFGGIASLFRELDFRPERIFPRGPEAAVYFSARCVAHNGRTLELDGIDLIELDETGRIRRLVGYWDPTPMLAVAQG